MQTENVPGASRRSLTVLRQAVDNVDTVFVPLRNAGAYARLDAADFDRLSACGRSFEWFVGADMNGAKHVQAPSRDPVRHPMLMVARVITGAAPSERVKFNDGDRFNLTRANLRRYSRAAVLVGGKG